MRDELRHRLQLSLAGARPVGAKGREPGGEAAAADGFVRDFTAKAERVVIPAMVEVGRLLEARGRFFSVERIPERRTCRGALVPASVQMNVFRRHRTTNFKDGAPHFNVVCDRLARRVVFRRTLAASVAATEDVGTCALDALTRDKVQDGLANMLDALARH